MGDALWRRVAEMDALMQARTAAARQRVTFDENLSGLEPLAQQMRGARSAGSESFASRMVPEPYGETVTATSPGATDDTLTWTALLAPPHPAGFKGQGVPTDSWAFNSECYGNWILRGTAAGAATLQLWCELSGGTPFLCDEVPIPTGAFPSVVLCTGVVPRNAALSIVVDGTVEDVRGTLELKELPADGAPSADEFPVPWAWYRGDDLTGYDPGDHVTEWPDRAGGAGTLPNDLTSPRVEGRYVADAVGGHPGIDLIQSDSANRQAEYVDATDTTSDDGGLTMALAFRDVSAEFFFDSQVFIRAAEGSVGPVDARDLFVSHRQDPERWSVDLVTMFYNGSAPAGPGPHFVMARWDGSGTTLWIDGTQVDSDSTPVAGFGIQHLEFNVTAAIEGDGPVPVLAEAIVWDRGLSDGEAGQVWAYAQGRYGL